MVLVFCLYAWHISGQGNMGFEGNEFSGWKTYKNGSVVNPLTLFSDGGLAITSGNMKVNSKVYEPAVCQQAGLNSLRMGYDKLGPNVSSSVALG